MAYEQRWTKRPSVLIGDATVAALFWFVIFLAKFVQNILNVRHLK